MARVPRASQPPRGFGLDGIMFLPQRPYLSVGTLRDQVIYPHTEIDMREAASRTQHYRRLGRPSRPPTRREGGWDARKEWKDVLSGGEKQRMGMARLFYHEPRYAFMDEGTSAVSSDVEGLLYERAKERGITLITISTPASLKKYHTYNLNLGLGAEGEAGSLRGLGRRRRSWVLRRNCRSFGSVWIRLMSGSSVVMTSIMSFRRFG